MKVLSTRTRGFAGWEWAKDAMWAMSMTRNVGLVGVSIQMS